MVFSLILPPFSAEPALELQPWMYEPERGSDHLNTFFSQNSPDHDFAAKLEETILAKVRGKFVTKVQDIFCVHVANILIIIT